MPAGLAGNPHPIVTPTRTAVIDTVAQAVRSRRDPESTFVVAIDGIDGSGKSTFADELAAKLGESNVAVVRSTIDSFHNPRRVRWRRGTSSPVGFYLDSHDLEALQRCLLDPFRAGPGREYVTAVFDEPSDLPVDVPSRVVAAGDVLVFDGIFVQRPELCDFWDLVVFVDGQERVDLRRLGLVLDGLPRAAIDVVDHVLQWSARIDRYASGMRYYLDLVDPIERSDIVIDNNDLANPTIVRRGGAGLVGREVR